MEPVKVPQNLELKDVLVWGLGAVDLVCLGVGGVGAWWMYLVVPGPVALRIGMGAPLLAVGAALALGRVAERPVREWALLVLVYLARPRRHVYGGDE